jgi:cell division inhibitor SepF
MALRDTWHRALVYFGLAEEPEYDEYGPDTVSEHDTVSAARPRRSGGNVRHLDRRRRHEADDFDDIFGDAPESRPRPSLRPVGNGGAGQVHFVTPRNFNDAQEVADQFKKGVPVILNLQTTGQDLSKRLIDFGSGLTYALDGGMQKIADKTFLLTPVNVEVSAEEKARLVEKGFFNQS